ncbi:helix-turn-helix domain-containing protein [Amycolatopsis minnesotensis]|uniref:MarR family protein n=1 Tax=Amycolatopsis minnesotensis TaxID=337894 RepID=A0ABN2REY1_9PSEU
MPGGRLTSQDRRRIASGLSDGLGYAEIARELGRPTSTVSREVARNGGPGDYRAGRAHQAAWRRARRPKRGWAAESTAGAEGRDPAAAGEFVDRLAAQMMLSGLPRMAARVFACLVTTDSGALTAGELVRGLRVSPASVSKAVAYLEELDVVGRARVPGQRHETYLIDDDVWLRTWLTSARTNARWSDTAREGAALFGTATPAGARLEQMGEFFARLAEDMSGGAGAVAFDDALTVLAALVHAGTPRTARELSLALGWPLDRVEIALRDAEKRPDLTDPVVLRHTGSGACTAVAVPDRLTAAQRGALDSPLGRLTLGAGS